MQGADNAGAWPRGDRPHCRHGSQLPREVLSLRGEFIFILTFFLHCPIHSRDPQFSVRMCFSQPIIDLMQFILTNSSKKCFVLIEILVFDANIHILLSLLPSPRTQHIMDLIQV
jgi:hypothetical protein